MVSKNLYYDSYLFMNKNVLFIFISTKSKDIIVLCMNVMFIKKQTKRTVCDYLFLHPINEAQSITD